jgi:plasmid replication initiation protein
MPNREGSLVRVGSTDERTLVVRRNELIHARYRMNLQEQRLLLWLIAQVKREDTDLTVYRIGVKQLAEFIGIEKSKSIYTELAQHTRSLMSRVAEIARVDEKTLTQLQFVSKTKYFFGNGYVELCLNEHMRPYVLQLKERFTEIELGYAIRLSSFYAIRIYELLKCSQYRPSGFEMSLADLRAELGIEAGKLKRMNNFKAKVMDIAEREINGRTDINFAYKWKKTGRTITAVRFEVRDQVGKPIKTLPGTVSDKLRQRLEDVTMPREEAERLLRKWAHTDPGRIVWHLEELARLSLQGKIDKPLAWLRAGLKKDYRPATSLFERDTGRRRREKLSRPASDASQPETGMVPIADLLAKDWREAREVSKNDASQV